MIRRFLTRVLLVILIAACGVNYLQVQRLQDQVAELQARQSQPKPGSLMKPPASEARQSISNLSISDLRTQWKHLKNRAGALGTAGKKVFSHVSPI